jgi:hypothetical protein
MQVNICYTGVKTDKRAAKKANVRGSLAEQ